jgi:hypothetical protein
MVDRRSRLVHEAAAGGLTHPDAELCFLTAGGQTEHATEVRAKPSARQGQLATHDHRTTERIANFGRLCGQSDVRATDNPQKLMGEPPRRLVLPRRMYRRTDAGHRIILEMGAEDA